MDEASVGEVRVLADIAAGIPAGTALRGLGRSRELDIRQRDHWPQRGFSAGPAVTPNRLDSSFASRRADTGASRVVRDLPHILGYPFTMVLKGADHGFGQYFGPIVLAFAPLLLLVRWKAPVARVAGVLWAVMFLSNVWSSQMEPFPAAGLCVESGVGAFGGFSRR